MRTPAERPVRSAAALCLAVVAGLSAAPAAADEAAYDEICAACHGPAGAGIPGIAPPLLNPDLWPRLGAKADDYLVGVMVAGRTGKLTVNGLDYIGLVMPSQAAADSGSLAAVAAYVLGDLNGIDAALLPDAAAIDAAKAAPPSNAALKALRAGE